MINIPNSGEVADRLAISDVIIQYAAALDQRDWRLLRSLMLERVWIDYRSFDPQLNLEMSAADWAERVRGLEGFDATQHISSNHLHRINGHQASCTSYMQAGHFLTRPDGDYHCFLYGHYITDLLRTAKGWKIVKVTLTITARHGDQRVFDWAFESVRKAG